MADDHKIAEGCIQAADDAITHAPKKDVGTFLKMVGVAIFILALTAGIALIIHGGISVNTDTKIEVNKDKEPAKDEAPAVIKKEITISGSTGAAANTSTTKIVQEVIVKPPQPK